jgi:DNA polymerase-1
LYHRFREELKQQPRTARIFVKLMMPASNVLTRMELRGIYVNQDRLNMRYEEAMGRLNGYRKYMLKYLPDEYRPNYGQARQESPRDLINFNSPKQVGDWLFNYLELEILEETKTGQPSTKESVLLQLSKKHPAVKALLQFRKWQKFMSTYLTPWKYEAVDERSRIHTTYKLYGTVTGRLSSEGPNLQNVPRDPFIRGILGAPPGWQFVEADYSQIELRIAAVLARENRMLREFLTGKDIHRTTAATIMGSHPRDVTPEQRKMAKAVNFGFLYGMGAKKFVDYALEKYDVEVTLEEAQDFRDQFFTNYPKLLPWHERQRRLAKRYERVQSPIGRVRHLPNVHSQDKHVRADAERQAINSPVQSFASDLMLLSMVRLDAVLPSRTARIVGTVHDQLLFQVRNESVAEVVPIIRSQMENVPLKKTFGIELPVPIEVEIKVGQHWTEGEVV